MTRVASTPGTVSFYPSGLTVEWVNTNGKKILKHYPRPDNCVAIFIGDTEGGSGFIIRLPDGRRVKRYVYTPPESVHVSMVFDNPPSEHLGQPILDASAETLCRLYLDYMISLGEEAIRVFTE